MTFPLHEVTIDLENINRRIYAYAREKASQDEANGVVTGPFKVEVSAPTGYAVADVLDYDTEQQRRNAKVRIIVSDVDAVKADIAEAKPGANAITKRALSTFSKAIDARIAELGASRVDRIVADWNNLISPSFHGNRLESTSLSDLIDGYNRLVRTRGSTLQVEMYGRNRLDVYVGSSRNYRRASISPFFGVVDGVAKTLYAVDLFPLGGFNSAIRNHLSNKLFESGVANEDNPYLVTDGRHLRKPITSLDEAMDVLQAIFNLLNANGRELVSKEIETRLTKLATVCGEITASFSDNSYVAFCAAEQMAA